MFGKDSGGAQSGMGMLMKTMGFDPAQINQQMETAKATAIQTIQHFDARLKAIESRLSAIEDTTSRIEKLIMESHEETAMNQLPPL